MKIFFLLLLTCSNFLQGNITLPKAYSSVIEQLIYFKDDHFKVFFGGPIMNGSGSQWLMPVLFENEKNRTRAIYELSFINCSPNSSDLSNAEIIFLRIADIDIKFQNVLSKEFHIFSNLINNSDKSKRYILIREVDISNVYYPDIFISSIYSDFRSSDKDIILNFLKTKFQVSGKIKDLTPNSRTEFCITKPIHEGFIGHKKIAINLCGQLTHFNVASYYLENDPWKLYYIITHDSKTISDFDKNRIVSLRIDSGCNSGQIYNDSSCDCLDQLHQGLMNIIKNQTDLSLLIHIPAHDGRGFGSAPKAETEIYKQGGAGRVNNTPKLNTIEAATLLYQTSDFDIRTYDGCAEILKLHRIREVNLLTDNKNKLESLLKYEISVKRKKTNTQKPSCLHHIIAKKNSKYYFSE